MRIVMATDFYPPFLGGVEPQSQSLSRELARSGHEVTLITVWRPGLLVEQRDGGVQIQRLKGLFTAPPWFSTVPGRRYHPPFPDPLIAVRLRRLVRAWHPDLVHTTGWISYSCALALLGLSTPLVLSARDFSNICAVRTLLRDGRICDGPALARCVRCASRSYGVPKALAAVLGVRSGRPLLRHKTAASHSISSYVDQVMQRTFWTDRSRLAPAMRMTIPDTLVQDSVPGERP
jgi:glycosyltransferase involved in cell wall biosynthesis